MKHLDIWEYLKLPNIKPKWTRRRNLRSFKCAQIQRQHICVTRPPILFIIGEVEGQLNQTPVPSPLKHTKSSSRPIAQSHTGHYMVPKISSSPLDTSHLPKAHSGLGGCMCPYLPTGSLEWTLLWYLAGTTSAILRPKQEKTVDEHSSSWCSVYYLHLWLLKVSLTLSPRQLKSTKGNTTCWNNPKRNTYS